MIFVKYHILFFKKKPSERKLSSMQQFYILKKKLNGIIIVKNLNKITRDSHKKKTILRAHN